MWPFKSKRKRIEIMFPFVAKMRQKDPVLYARIQHLPVGLASRVWRETYAEDFPQDRLYVYWPHPAS